MPHEHLDEQQRTESTNPANALYAYIGAFVDELSRAGVHHAVVCPGSRSTPLALALAQQPGIRIWMHIDERSAAFFALGMAKRLHEPIVLLCTSGTAAANCYPAIVEAKLVHAPLLVLTADRPPELRENGAPQAIVQNRLYGVHVKWYMEAALPEATNESLRYIRTLADRAVAQTLAIPAGPVHVNFPLREPLTPEPERLLPPEKRDTAAWYGRPNHASYTSVSEPLLAGQMGNRLAKLADRVSVMPRGLIVVGPVSDMHLIAPLLRLARTLRYPLLADPLSQLRISQPQHGQQAPIICTYDAFLRDEAFAEAYAPEIILRFGAMPTSKALLLYLKRHADCQQVVIDGNGDWNEPTLLATEMIHADPVTLCDELCAAYKFHHHEEKAQAQTSPLSWEASWQQAEGVTRRALLSTIEAFPERFEGRVFTELAQLLPDNTTLVVGNSMPVRDLDAFFWDNEHTVHIAGNRGANGIDGVISTALGISAVSKVAEAGARTVLVIGDLSFFHDQNGLLAAKLHHLDLTIILINNDGGGIFSFLPQASYQDHFEQLFGTPTGLDFQHTVEMYGGRFQRITTWEEFCAAIEESGRQSGLQVIEVPTERDANVLMHRHLWQSVHQALQEHGSIPAQAEVD